MTTLKGCALKQGPSICTMCFKSAFVRVEGLAALYFYVNCQAITSDGKGASVYKNKALVRFRNNCVGLN